MVFYDKSQKRTQYFHASLIGFGCFVFISVAFALAGLSFQKVGEYRTAKDVAYKQTNDKVLALTFDDGPDPVFTPEILAILKEEKVPGTFFVIGEHVMEHPSIIRDINEAGFEIGNHTYTHSEAVHNSPARLQIELTATAKAVGQITGTMPLMYRPPFLQDIGLTMNGGPVREEQLEVARQLGYVVVGADIESRDWDAGSAEQVEQMVRDNLKEGRHVILFHDGGGPDRTNTIKALKKLIPELKAEGYTFVPASYFFGLSQKEVMPPISSVTSIGDGVLFTYLLLMAKLSGAIGIITLAVLVLTFFRISTMLIMRYVFVAEQKTYGKKHGYRGAVAVIIPAYNEEANIDATITSVIENSHPPDQVIVVDDGSKDKTAERVRALIEHYGDRLQLIQVTNGGKARALNIGIAYARPNIVICIDGDTIFHHDAIAKLIRHFDDPKVGVVAGKVVPVREETLLDKFQIVEYMIGQNIEKEVLAVMNAVGVVPGAVGAWRKSVIRARDGYPEDTIVEDQDLTLSFLVQGYKIVYEGEAIAYTEAPNNIKDFMKQRSRWVFGTFQCFWKYRKHVGSMERPSLGWIVLPNILLFNTILPLLTPFMDIFALVTILEGGGFKGAVIAFFVFTLIDMTYAALAIASDQNPPYRLIWTVIIQRIFYRYAMFYVVSESMIKAIKGNIAPKSRWKPPTRQGHAQAAFDGVNRLGGRPVKQPITASMSS